MSKEIPAYMKPTSEDIKLMLACHVQIGTKNVDAAMVPYIWGRRADGVYIINLAKTFEKLVFAARIIAGIENPEDVCVIAAKEVAQRAVLKFAKFTGAQALAGRYTPGTFTNQIQRRFLEPMLLIATDPHTDRQAIVESSYVNLPCVSFASTESPLRFVDVAIPCNNKGRQAIGLMYWMLCREVLRIRGEISRKEAWPVMVDLFLFREPEDKKAAIEEKKEEAVVAEEKPVEEEAKPAEEQAAAPAEEEKQ